VCRASRPCGQALEVRAWLAQPLPETLDVSDGERLADERVEIDSAGEQFLRASSGASRPVGSSRLSSTSASMSVRSYRGHGCWRTCRAFRSTGHPRVRDRLVRPRCRLGSWAPRLPGAMTMASTRLDRPGSARRRSKGSTARRRPARSRIRLARRQRSPARPTASRRCRVATRTPPRRHRRLRRGR
jgi:hypothetical protein